MPYRRLPANSSSAREEVMRLAQQHTVEAMEKLIGLLNSPSQFVQMTAARTVLLQAEPGSLRSPRSGRSRPQVPETVNVKIARFDGGNERGADQRDRELPMVQGGREGSRDPGDDEGTGLPPVRRKRKGVREQP